MRIALIGYGKMGHEIEVVAREQGDTISRIFDSAHPVSAGALTDAAADVCIDFSKPAAAIANVYAALEARKDIVVGTTGWFDQIEAIRPLVQYSGVLYSPNFSLGMNIFMRIAERAAELMQNNPAYDPFIHEVHHRQKVDAPSGTALRLADILMSKIERKSKIVTELTGKIEADALQVTATRTGFVAGTHTIGFDSEADSIELRHTAKNRRGFALGAAAAARWLQGRKGVFTMDDVDL